MHDNTRVIACSYRELSVVTGRDPRTVERGIQSLVAKKIIVVVAKATARKATTYRVFSYREILRRREAWNDAFADDVQVNRRNRVASGGEQCCAETDVGPPASGFPGHFHAAASRSGEPHAQ